MALRKKFPTLRALISMRPVPAQPPSHACSALHATHRASNSHWALHARPSHHLAPVPCCMIFRGGLTVAEKHDGRTDWHMVWIVDYSVYRSKPNNNSPPHCLFSSYLSCKEYDNFPCENIKENNIPPNSYTIPDKNIFLLQMHHGGIKIITLQFFKISNEKLYFWHMWTVYVPNTVSPNDKVDEE